MVTSLRELPPADADLPPWVALTQLPKHLLGQRLDLDGGVPVLQLAVESGESGVRGLGERGEIIIGPQFVAALVSGGDGPPRGLKVSGLLGPQDAVVRPELVDNSPCAAARDYVLAQDGPIRQQPQQAHLSDPAQREVIFLLAKVVGRGAMMDVPTPGCREPHANVGKDHLPAYLSMSSASSAASMSAFVTLTLGLASRPTRGRDTRVARAGRAGTRSSWATARVTRSLRVSPRSAALTFAACMSSSGMSTVVRILAS